MSTSIETNTEKLQEILSGLYDLNMTTVDTNEPDLTIVVDEGKAEWVSSWGLHGRPEKFEFNPNEVVNVYNKLMANKTIKCVLNAVYHPWSGNPVPSSSPHITAYTLPKEWNSSGVGFLYLIFNIYTTWNEGLYTVKLDFDIHPDNSVILSNVYCGLTGGFTSAWY